VVATVGISGPTARLEDRVDHVGRLLMEQTEALSALLRHGNRPEA
jgi:DNA-binding IclR family transcriptional regulator